MADWLSANAVRSYSQQFRNIAGAYESKRVGAVADLTALGEVVARFRVDHEGPDITTIADLADAVLVGLESTVTVFADIEAAFLTAADAIVDLEQREVALRSQIAALNPDVVDSYTGAYSYTGTSATTHQDRQAASAAQTEFYAIQKAEEAVLQALADSITTARTGDNIVVDVVAVDEILHRFGLETTDPTLTNELMVSQAVLRDGADGEIDGTEDQFEVLIRNGATPDGAARVVNGEYSAEQTAAIYEHGLIPRVVDVQNEHGISYTEAEAAVMANEIEYLQNEINTPDNTSQPSRQKLLAERDRRIDLWTRGDTGLSLEVQRQLYEGRTIDQAAETGVAERYGDASLNETLTGLDTAFGGADGDYATVFTAGFQEQVYVKSEKLLGTDFDDDEGPQFEQVDIGLLALAEEQNVSYNQLVADILLTDPADLPTHYRDNPPGFLDLPVDDDTVAAVLAVKDFDNGDVFTEIETAANGERDGKLSQADLDAILADPDASNTAKHVARYLNTNPDTFNHLDTAKNGRFLSGLDEGDYQTLGNGDGIVSRSDIHQHRANKFTFDTLNNARKNGVLGPPDRNDGTYSETALIEVRAGLPDPNPDGTRNNDERLAMAIDVTLQNHSLDNRSGWNKFGDAVFSHGGVLGVGWELAGYHDDNPTETARLTNNPLGYATSFGKGVADFGVGVYDLTAMVPGSPAFFGELAMTQASDQFDFIDHDEHRGFAQWRAMRETASSVQSFIPGTDEYNQANENRRRTGSWDDHTGYNTAKSAINLDTFYYDPGRFAGQVAPETLLAVATAGTSTTATIARVTIQQGIKIGARTALRITANNTRAWITAPAKIFTTTTNGLNQTLTTLRRHINPDNKQKPNRPESESSDLRIEKRQEENQALMESKQFAEDQKAAGVTQTDIKQMWGKERPLGFKSAEQFNDFQTDLFQALDDAGLSSAEVGLKGTATTFYSENPGKPLGHHWDKDPDNPGDYDLNIADSEIIRVMKEKGIEIHPKYGIYRTTDLMKEFPSLEAFSRDWQYKLGREVNFVGYPKTGTVRDTTEYEFRRTD